MNLNQLLHWEGEKMDEMASMVRKLRGEVNTERGMPARGGKSDQASKFVKRVNKILKARAEMVMEVR